MYLYIYHTIVKTEKKIHVCGIVGIISFSEKGNEKLKLIDTATDSLSKRGPDSRGVYLSDNIAIGHRRLSIIDTSSNGAQPMSDVSKRYIIAFNGEIFNYKELREELLNKNITLFSESDTEVLLNWYILEKEKCLSKLNGEFSFAIYDKQKEELFLARDRFGIKPLNYYQDEDCFIFASELKAITAFNIKKEIDTSALKIYFHLNYIPSPFTIYKNVKKHHSACFSYISRKNILLNSIYYKKETTELAETSYTEAQQKLETLLTKSVESRMISDVPLGCFLSGGIDSSIITAIAAKNTKHLHTFSIGFKDEPFFDETAFATVVAKHCNTNHTVFSLTNSDFFSNLFDFLDYLDEPFADSSALAVYILSKHTKKQVTVALSGDGADELFGGYNKHSAELKARTPGITNDVLKKINFLFALAPKSRNSTIGNKFRQLYKYSNGLLLNDANRYWSWAGFNSEEELNELLKINDEGYTLFKNKVIGNITSDFNSVLEEDIRLVLENDMLVKADRMSMANSLEVRVPFLDHELVDFVLSLPSHYKINEIERKRILKDAFKQYLPSEIFNRNKKGFEVPLLKWFRHELKSFILDEVLNDQFILEQNIFNVDAIRKIKKELFSNAPNDAVAKTWALLVFQYWWKKNLN